MSILFPNAYQKDHLPSKTYANRLPTRCFCITLQLYIFPLLSLLYLSFYSSEFSYHQYFGNKKRRTTKVIRRIFSNRVFYAGRQPRYPAKHHKVPVINLPSRSTALTCRHTETFLVHLCYTQLRPKYQLEFRFSQNLFTIHGIWPCLSFMGFDHNVHILFSRHRVRPQNVIPPAMERCSLPLWHAPTT